MSRSYVVLLAFALLLGALTALWKHRAPLDGAAGPGSVEDVQRGDPGPTAPDGAVLVDDLADAGSSPGTDRTAAEETDVSAPANYRVRVNDSFTGVAVPRFWIKPAGLQDLASEVPRVLNEPGKPEAVLGADAWPDPDAPRFILVSAPMYQPKEIPATGNVVEVALDRQSGIIGVVRDGNSAPLPFADVTVEALDPAAPIEERVVPMPDSFRGATLRKTDREGAFAFHGIPAGLYRTTVRRDGARKSSAPFFVRPGEWAHSDHWLDERIRVAVTLVTPLGEPAPASRISVTDARGTGAATEDAPIVASRYTGDDGRATLGPLPPGSYRVIVLSDQGSAEPAELVIAEDAHPLQELSIQLVDK